MEHQHLRLKFMPLFYSSLQLNVCDCLLLLCRENFLMDLQGQGTGAWDSFPVKKYSLTSPAKIFFPNNS